MCQKDKSPEKSVSGIGRPVLGTFFGMRASPKSVPCNPAGKREGRLAVILTFPSKGLQRVWIVFIAC